MPVRWFWAGVFLLAANLAGQHSRDLPGHLVRCGGTNDSSSLEAANKAGVWNFEPGETCLIDNQVKITAANVKWHLNGATLKRKNRPSDASGSAAASPTFALNVTGNGFEISGGTIDGNGVLQGPAAGPNAIVYVQAGDVLVEKVTFLNSGTSQPKLGALFLYAWSGTIRDNTFANTILGWPIFSNGNAAGMPARIERNTINGSEHGGIAAWHGASGGEMTISENTIRNIRAIDSGARECGSNTGECGNGISLFVQGGRTTISHNRTGPTTFSGIRINQAADVLVEDNDIGGADETALFIQECPGSNIGSCAPNTIAGGNRAIGNHIHDSAYGINDTNIPGRIGFSTQTSEPSLIERNTLENIRGYGIHMENAQAINNTLNGVAECFTVGQGSVGYGNLLASNTCVNSGIPVAVSKDLTKAPRNQFGPITVTGTAAAGPALAMANDSFLVITAASKSSPVQLTYDAAQNGGANPTNGQVYVLTAVYGMAQLNRQLCTVANVNTRNHTLQCAGIDSTGYGTFATNPAANVLAAAYLVYSRDTTPAYRLPAAWVDKR